MVFLRIDAGRLRIVAAQSETLERNKRRPRIVVAASKRGTRTRVRKISDDGSGVARTSPFARAQQGHTTKLMGASSPRNFTASQVGSEAIYHSEV